jgi:serine protease Do
MRTCSWLAIPLLLSITFLNGCVSATRIVKNESAPAKEYSDLYFVEFTQDPRNIQPKAIKAFEAMGFNVKVVSSKNPIEGAQGTGFVVSPDGQVLTCAHVVGDQKVATFWVSGVRYEADVIDPDKDKDLVLLRPKKSIAPAVSAMSFRSDNHYSIGADVSTIGYPLGNVLGTSVRYTKGSISSLTGIQDDAKQLQVSAQIQPGNSGGPLFDINGVVIGVIQQTLNPLTMAEQTGGQLPQNVNFAIKSEVVLEYLKTNKGVYDSLQYDRAYSIEQLQKSVVRVRGGNITDEWEKKPKLVARVVYASIWDGWYRFRYFVVRVYDFDSQQLLFTAGQGRDNIVSNEDVVITDTFAKVQKALHKG